MREQIELLKNLRDTNWVQFRSWNSIALAKSPTELDKTLQTNNYYIVTNNFNTNKTIHIEKLSSFSLSKEIITQEFQKINSPIRLYIDTLGRYSHECTNTNEKTNFASFVHITPLTTTNIQTATSIPVDRSYKVEVFFVSFNK